MPCDFKQNSAPIRRLVALNGLAFLLAFAWSPVTGAIVSPEVHGDGRITFRTDWPKAERVELVGRSPNKGHDFPLDEYALQRGADGVWEVTVGPLPPGIYLYRLRVDGVECIDPLNPAVQRFFAGPWSKVEARDSEGRPWNTRPDVPRGKVEIRRPDLRSPKAPDRPVRVYLPSGVDQHAAARLPVLYLLHGWDYDESAWDENGRIPTILDNLIHDGAAVPMIVVMPLGFSIVPGPGIPWPDDEHARWSRFLISELIPWIEANYPVIPGRDHRAIAGFSMGGKQSLMLALGRPQEFAWVGCFSSGKQSLENYNAGVFRPAFAPESPTLRLVWLGGGRGDLHFAKSKTVARNLENDGLSVRWHEYDGRHTWHVWRQCFSGFARDVFRPAAEAGDN